jgi:hypothetical protein
METAGSCQPRRSAERRIDKRIKFQTSSGKGNTFIRSQSFAMMSLAAMRYTRALQHGTAVKNRLIDRFIFCACS